MNETVDSLSVETVEEIPDRPTLSRLKKSRSQRLVETVIDSPTRKIRISAPNEAELVKTYKSLLQWLDRHKELKVSVRKDADCLYLWQDLEARKADLLARLAQDKVNEMHVHPSVAEELKRRQAAQEEAAAVAGD